MSDLKTKSRIPVKKSSSNKTSEPKTTEVVPLISTAPDFPYHSAGPADEPHTKETSLSSSELTERSEKKEILTVPAKTAKRKLVRETPTKRGSSYSDKYSKSKSRQRGKTKEEQGFIKAKSEEKVFERTKEKRVNFQLPPPQNKEDPTPNPDFDSINNNLSTQLQLNVLENTIDQFLSSPQDLINTNRVFFAQGLGCTIDGNPNDAMEGQQSEAEGSSPISNKKQGKPKHSSGHRVVFDYNSEQYLNKEYCSAKERKIVEAITKANCPEKAKKVDKQNERKSLKSVVLIPDDVKKAKISKQKRNSKSEKSGPVLKINQQEESEGINEIVRSVEVESVDSEPTFADLTIPDPAIVDDGFSEKRIPRTRSEQYQRDILEAAYRQEICSERQKEMERLRLSMLNNEDELDLHILQVQEQIAEAHKTLDSVEEKIGFRKGVLLAIFLGIVISCIVYFAWTLFQKHCESKPVKLPPTWKESIVNWIYSFFSNPTKDAPPKSNSWFS